MSAQFNPFGGGGFGPTGIEGIDIGPGGINVQGTVGGVPISGTIPIGGGGGGEPTQGSPSVPGAGLVAPSDPGSGAGCRGLFQVRGPDGSCIDLTALPPGGDPAMYGQVQQQNYSDGYGAAVKGIYGVGLVPRVEVQTVRRCPRGMALGKDGVCYEGLGRNSKKRAWPMGMKPLLTPGERNAIRIAGRVAGKLKRSQKTLKKTARALEKAC